MLCCVSMNCEKYKTEQKIDQIRSRLNSILMEQIQPEGQKVKLCFLYRNCVKKYMTDIAKRDWNFFIYGNFHLAYNNRWQDLALCP